MANQFRHKRAMAQHPDVPDWSHEDALREMARLIAPGILGFYSHVEVTEVFACPPGQSSAINVFSILVVEERLTAVDVDIAYLNPQRIKLKSLKDWSFGIKRYLKPIADLVPAFEVLGDTKTWRLSGSPLETGELIPIPTQFAPPDSTGIVPWNRVLKNNFWNGSHLLEWADPAKSSLQALFEEPTRLQELSEEVRRYVPIGLASFSDRLSNIVVQLPVTVLIAKFGQIRASGDFTADIEWHRNATPRPLRASCERTYDNTITGFSAAAAEAPRAVLPMQDAPGMHRGVLWDDENKVIMAATGDLSFVKSIVLNMMVLDPEPRVFTVADGSGEEKAVRVGLMPKPIKSVVGPIETNPAGSWTQRRMYREETDRLAAERRFVQYKPQPGSSLREKALADLRLLINQHGQEGTWLWDPFLSANDVLDTLFYCQFFGSDLRALSGGKRPFEEGAERSEATFAEDQRAILDNVKSNLRGLNLEYRVKTGSAGWNFHDRFLIFPSEDAGALAWSLGTSINSVGKQHHILQRVDDGQRILDAFKELWDQLNRPEHLVWKKP